MFSRNESATNPIVIKLGPQNFAVRPVRRVIIDLGYPLLTLILVCLNAAQKALPLSERKFLIPNPNYFKYQNVSPISKKDGDK